MVHSASSPPGMLATAGLAGLLASQTPVAIDQLALEHLARCQREGVVELEPPRVLVGGQHLASPAGKVGARISSPARCAGSPAGCTTAQTSSPYLASGTPITGTEATAGCRCRTSSTSRGRRCSQGSAQSACWG